MTNRYSSFEEIIKIENKLTDMKNEYFIFHDLFTFQWWLLLVILFVPWFIWWKLVSKRRLKEILLYGLLVQTLDCILNEFGCQLNLWEYPYDIEPLFPRLIPINFTVIPVTYMLIYQYFSKWKSFFIANVLVATVFSFIAEPILVWLGIYELYNWKHIYSFPIYIIMALFLKWLVMIIVVKQKQCSGKTTR